MKKGFKHILLGVVTFIVAMAPFLIRANACAYYFNETKVPKCLK